MGFHNLLFPKQISAGSRGGTAYDTRVSVADSGATKRTSLLQPQHSRVVYDIAKGVQSEEDLAALLSHHRCVRGAAASFRFFNPTDWSTHHDGVGAPTPGFLRHHHAMEPAVRTSGVQTHEFRKVYGAGTAFQRRITRLIPPGDADSFVEISLNGQPIWRNGVTLIPSPAFRLAIDYEAGLLHWATTPTSFLGFQVSASFTHHTPVRFGDDADAMTVSWDESDQFNVQSMRVEERVVDHQNGAEEWWDGGHFETVLLNGSVFNISLSAGAFQRFTGTGPATVIIPDTGVIPSAEFVGGPYLFLQNAMTNALSVQRPGIPIGTMNSNTSTAIYLDPSQFRFV